MFGRIIGLRRVKSQIRPTDGVHYRWRNWENHLWAYCLIYCRQRHVPRVNYSGIVQPQPLPQFCRCGVWLLGTGIV